MKERDRKKFFHANIYLLRFILINFVCVCVCVCDGNKKEVNKNGRCDLSSKLSYVRLILILSFFLKKTKI
jgi:hypothetical protein